MFSYVILSQAHASATKPWHMFPSYVLHMIVSLALVAATCPCQLFHRVILGDFVPGTCLCYNTLLPVLLVCIACDVVADTCRRNTSPHQNPSCLTTFTETWLQSHIHANVVELNGYDLIRKDRQEGIHGGICICIKDSIKVSLLDILSTSSLGVLWVNLRPTRLPRCIYSIIVGTVYHPPNADNTEMSKYLMETLSFIESNYINCGIIILSDFNRLNV